VILDPGLQRLVQGAACRLTVALCRLTAPLSAGGAAAAAAAAACSNALCVFELPLGKPLLRHWADASGDPLYYGAVAASTLVIRGISAVYNYDYIQVCALWVWGGGVLSSDLGGGGGRTSQHDVLMIEKRSSRLGAAASAQVQGISLMTSGAAV
jgi:Cu2+-containing amine oxidase